MLDSVTVIQPMEDIEPEVEPNLSCGLARIIKHGVEKLRNKVVRLLTVQWGNNPIESTWKIEEKT